MGADDSKPIQLATVNCESEGRQALIKLGLAQAEICKKTGLLRQRVNDYWNGKRKPDDGARHLLAALGIAADTWDRLPVKIQPEAQPAAEQPQDSELDNVPVFDQRIGTLEAVRADIKSLEEILASGKIPPTYISSTMNTLKAYRLAEANMLEKLQDTETEWAKSQAFRELVDHMYEILKPHPQAIADLRKALEHE